jgi:peptide-methionine (R)-S-oxide reductase
MSLRNKDEDFWREKLTDEQYKVLRQKATEQPFSGKLLENSQEGVYKCAACGKPLFQSETKFDSGSGWPSFYDAITDNIQLKKDNSHSMNRIEVLCRNCGSHLGHLFEDGPQPTGKRFCINSISLNFKQKDNE